MNLEDAILNNLGQQMSDAVDRQLMVKIAYSDYKKIDVPGWIYNNNVINDWVKETLPECAFISSTFYYQTEADATLFRLKWL
jgi:hypothetical protein